MKQRMHLALIVMLAQAHGVSTAEDIMTDAQAVHFLAVMIASGEVCAARHPGLQNGVDHWGEKLDSPTREWATRVRRTPEFAEALAEARVDKQVLEITEEQCNLNFK